MKQQLRFIIILFICFSSIKGYTQDLIVKNDKTEIKSKVEEITDDVIKYKKFEMLDGPTYSINKREVFMIVYKNGTKEYIENTTPTQPIQITNNTRNAEPLSNRQETNNNDDMEPGIYYWDPVKNDKIEIDASNITNSKSGGIGENLKRNLISGLINSKTKVSLSGEQAAMKINNATPMFLFIIDVTKKGFNTNSSYLGNVSSPNDFFIVQMKVLKGCREIVTGKHNDASDNYGIDDKIKVPFKYEKIKKGVYKVVTEQPLTRGEYCFMFASSSIGEGTSRKIYDFSIQ